MNDLHMLLTRHQVLCLAALGTRALVIVSRK